MAVPVVDKLVFAHWFPSFPPRINNLASAADYYATQFLDPAGEAGKHLAYGGFLRDRPLPITPSPSTSPTWELDDAEYEVDQAKAYGIDGFNLEMLALHNSTGNGVNNWRRQKNMMQAAQNDGAFKMMLMPDMIVLKTVSFTDLAESLRQLATYTSAFRLADGRLVVSPYSAEQWTVTQWTDFLAVANAAPYNLNIAFVPCFSNWGSYTSFAPISFGLAVWGERNANAVANNSTRLNQAHALNKVFMAPVAVQDERPRSDVYDEARGSETLRNSWAAAINGGGAGRADWVQIPTWNDHSEHSGISPTVAHGDTFLRISQRYATAWKTGSYPAVTEDQVHLLHRRHLRAATPTLPQTRFQSIRDGASAATPAVDLVEVLCELTAPATVTVTGAGISDTYTATPNATTGVHVKTYTLTGSGSISVVVSRSAVPVKTVSSRTAVLAAPVVQDMQYWASSSAFAVTPVVNTPEPGLPIQIARGTAAKWAAANPTLLLGEPVMETDGQKRRKVGDGRHYNDTPYVADRLTMYKARNGVKTGHDSFSRDDASATILTQSGVLHLTMFECQKEQPATGLTYWTGTAGSGATLVRVGLWLVEENEDLTPLASSPAATTAIGSSAATVFSFSAAVAGGLVLGKRYAHGFLQVGGTQPGFAGLQPSSGPLTQVAPRLCGAVNDLTDLPSGVIAAATIAAASNNRRLYGIVNGS